jgi:hypothetical protein
MALRACRQALPGVCGKQKVASGDIQNLSIPRRHRVRWVEKNVLGWLCRLAGVPSLLACRRMRWIEKLEKRFGVAVHVR